MENSTVEVTCLEGPVEEIGGKLVLLIPLAAGGSHLVLCSRGIGVVEGENLKVTIPQWLAAKLGIAAGGMVLIDNRGGKFNLRAARVQ
jgi:hypothetical protein